jgi:hypothetical protein
MKDEFIKDGIWASGEYPAYVTAYCNLTYDNFPWAVGIAQSETFTASF